MNPLTCLAALGFGHVPQAEKKFGWYTYKKGAVTIPEVQVFDNPQTEDCTASEAAAAKHKPRHNSELATFFLLGNTLTINAVEVCTSEKTVVLLVYNYVFCRKGTKN